MGRPARRPALPAIALAVVLLASACGGSTPTGTATPTGSAGDATGSSVGATGSSAAATESSAPASSASSSSNASSTTGSPVASGDGVVGVPARPPASTGNAVLFHLQLAADIDTAGNPIGQGTAFPAGTKAILGLLGWSRVPAGTELRLRLYRDDRLLSEVSHTVVRAKHTDDANVGFVFPFADDAGFADGSYSMTVTYDGGLEEVVPFTVGTGPKLDETVGTGIQTGPIPYANPADVLVVTRFPVLRRELGADADAVLAAAARVGDLHDLDADGVSRETPSSAANEVHRLLAKRSYKYLLIVGNDDAVPYFHIRNPLETDETQDLADWELPADWLPTDNMYTDLDKDPYQVPDIPVARIPSSDDAALLLTQLGENVPPDGGGYALLNQERKSQAGLTIGTMSGVVGVRVAYAPPVTPAAFAGSYDATNARYLYVLLHGIGVATDSWATNTVVWQPLDTRDPLSDEWTATESNQVDAVTVQSNPTSRGVVFVGACYGAWTLDTIQQPVHKTADNNLALHYLKGGARAFVADTHLSYTMTMAAGDIPAGRTGFEILYWEGLRDGLSPIDAFERAKVGLGAAIDALIRQGDIDTAKIDYKTLHYMVYLGRP